MDMFIDVTELRPNGSPQKQYINMDTVINFWEVPGRGTCVNFTQRTSIMISETVFYLLSVLEKSGETKLTKTVAKMKEEAIITPIIEQEEEPDLRESIISVIVPNTEFSLKDLSTRLGHSQKTIKKSIDVMVESKDLEITSKEDGKTSARYKYIGKISTPVKTEKAGGEHVVSKKRESSDI
jgi:hypothetical protein